MPETQLTKWNITYLLIQHWPMSQAFFSVKNNDNGDDDFSLTANKNIGSKIRILHRPINIFSCRNVGLIKNLICI